jgi:hypothetical protein
MTLPTPQTAYATFLAVLLFARILGVADGFSGPSFSAAVTTGSTVLPSSAANNLYYCCDRRRRVGILFASTGASSSPPLTPVPNEFSRPLNTDRILKTSSGNKRRSYREYQTTIEATAEECSALADRFELKRVDSLKAGLSLSLPTHYTSQSGGGYLIVQVEGSIVASLTQTCVRTNEEFEVTVEFPVSNIVKPVSPSATLQQLQAGGDEEAAAPAPKKQQQNNKKPKKNLRSDRVQNLSGDMTELQQMINRQEDENDFGIDDFLEDESIYSLATGNLDVGELVAQTFWLNLDPYPKKPGSGPMEFTISG